MNIGCYLDIVPIGSQYNTIKTVNIIKDKSSRYLNSNELRDICKTTTNTENKSSVNK